jgi:hypothetical protein
MKEVAFAHKQRAIRQALAMGEQIARRRAHAALAAALTAWRVQVRAGGRRFGLDLRSHISDLKILTWST